MTPQKYCAVILAAGKGTRMHSSGPKVLKTLLGEPMLHYVYAALDQVLGSEAYTVVGHGADQVAGAFPDRAASFIIQEQQLGTGHAFTTAWEAVKDTGVTHCLVVNGDTPLLPPAAIRRLLDESAAATADLVFLSITPEDPAAFGRVVRDENGQVSAIVEAKDYDPAAHGPATGEINAGIYLFRMSFVAPLLPRLTNDNKSGEYYITDLAALALEAGGKVLAVNMGDAPELLGVNSGVELVRAERYLRKSLVNAWTLRGVLIRRPGQVVIGPRARLAPGVEIAGPAEILGQSDIGPDTLIGSSTIIIDSHLVGCEIKPFSHLEGAMVETGAVIGPFARLRPGAVVRTKARVGNFVEMKKSELGPGAKAGHLTYLGDAQVGAEANIGAGTITCNYDGKKKHVTKIGQHAFIGSNTALVAPVSVGENAMVGAGSVITQDVPDGHLGISRPEQKNIPRKQNKA